MAKTFANTRCNSAYIHAAVTYLSSCSFLLNPDSEISLIEKYNIYIKLIMYIYIVIKISVGQRFRHFNMIYTHNKLYSIINFSKY